MYVKGLQAPPLLLLGWQGNSTVKIHLVVGYSCESLIHAPRDRIVEQVKKHETFDRTGVVDHPFHRLCFLQEDTDRDFFMTPREALEYGLVDEVIKTKTSDLPLPAMPYLA